MLFRSVGRRLTGNNFHRYLNPDRESDEAALRVHGLTTEFLQDKPRFPEIAKDLVSYIAGAELIIHNAAFDVAFLNAELARVKGSGDVAAHCAGVIDSLRLARDLHPGRRNSLDSLCERYQIDNSHRTLHGALLDASLLADVYIAMTRGQDSLAIELESPATGQAVTAEELAARPVLRVLAPSAEELAADRKSTRLNSSH